MKRLKQFAVAILMTAVMTITSFAGQWKQDTVGWWYQEDNGSYPINCWQWIDGNGDGIAENYYFNENGYCLMNTITPDGNAVNANGAWTIAGVVQTRFVGWPGAVNAGTDSQQSTAAVSQSAGAKQQNTNAVSQSAGASQQNTTAVSQSAGVKQQNTNAVSQSAGAKQQETSSASAQTEVKKPVEETVWLSATGSKYHRIPNCGRMNPNKARQVSLDQAVAQGFERCKNCY